MKEDADPLRPSDYMPFAKAHEEQEVKIIYNDDPEVHSKLIMAAVFGYIPEDKNP